MSLSPSSLLWVMSGGALGAGARYAVGQWALTLPHAARWPVATFAVNIVGGLAMGVLAGWLARGGVGEGWRLFIGVGLLGGFTTFSAFSLELVTMLQSGRSVAALGYALASVVGAGLALYAGMMMARAL